jgi:chaperonin GroEL
MTKSGRKWQTPCVVFQPETYQGMKRGIKQITQAIIPTLGPLPRLVVSESTLGADHRPELLDDGATIARRIIQIKGRDEDMGAMFLRHALWRLHESAGDGTATAAVMFNTIFEEGVKYIVAGGNAVRLRCFLDEICGLILQELDHQVIHLHGKQALAQLAQAISHHNELAQYLGEIFDIIGEYGRLEIRQGRGLRLEREYIEGMYWDGGLISRLMIDDIKTGTTQLEVPVIFISDLSFKEPQELVPILETAVGAGYKSLLLIAAEISERAMGLLLHPDNRERLKVVAVRSPAIEAQRRMEALEDLAILSGGRAFHSTAGHTASSIKLEDLGMARRIWADQQSFGIVGGKGDPKVIRKHIGGLRTALRNMGEARQRKALQERIGKIMGGTAVLWVGGTTPLQVESLQELAQRTADAMRGAIHHGVVAGGGVALSSCRRILEEWEQRTLDPDERAAYHMAAKALQAPMCTLMSNAGYNLEHWVEKINNAGNDMGFDVVTGEIVNMKQAGIFDSAGVVKAAVTTAFHGATLGLSVDVLVHVSDPPEGYQTA